MTGTAYMGGVLNQIWLKSYQEMNELSDKQVNAQKKKFLGLMQAKMCAIK